jgi:actin-like ATPase involved in cell morphogenesis
MRLLARPGPVGLAIDLGTARTRVHRPGDGSGLDEPTLVARRGADVAAAGRDAWRTCTRTDARLCWPVRRGVVVDPVSCVRLLTLLLGDVAGRRAPGVVAVAVRSGGDPYDDAVTAAVVASATGAAVRRVESLLAAAIGAGLAVDEPAAALVCDLGAGTLDLGAVGDGRLLASTSVPLGTHDWADDPLRVLAEARTALRRVLDALPPGTAGDLAARPVVLVGGGALVRDVPRRLAEAWRTDVAAAPEPRLAVVAGLARCLGSHLDLGRPGGDLRPPSRSELGEDVLDVRGHRLG